LKNLKSIPDIAKDIIVMRTNNQVLVE